MKHHHKEAISYYCNIKFLNNDAKYQFAKCFHYLALNKGDVKDNEMEEVINTITDGLFSVFVALGMTNISNIN